jgi:AMIN domain
MKIAILILPALAMLAFAQEPTVNSPVHLESVTTEAAQGEVRITIDLSAPVESSADIVVRDKSLILDLPGIAYKQNEKRLVINRNGVEDVWISVHQQDPPLTRITVRLSRLEPYVLSRDGTQISLQIGAAAKANSRQQGSGTIPTARAGGIARVFRRAPKQPSYEPPETSATQKEPPPVLPPPIRFSDTPPTGQSAVVASPQPAAASDAKGALASLWQPLPLVRVAPPRLMPATEADTPPEPEQVSNMLEPPLNKTPVDTAEIRAAPVVANPDLHTIFHVKFVQQDAAYIDAGRNAGLAEGMKLVVVNGGPNSALPNGASPTAVVAELTIVGIAETSAVTEIHVLQRDVVPGDLAVLSDTDLQTLVQQHTVSATRKYPAVISFTEDDDALDEEARVQDVPRPPLPSVNRMQGRIGFDYFGTHSLDASQANGRDLGVVLRADFTRIGGTYWNFQGYYNGVIDSTSAASQTTLQELINRTYQLGLTYDNPTGPWVAGFGRLYLPWASSLDAIDGGYVGRRVHPGVIVGIFAGSTPDPTSWNYNPNQQTGGTFVNFSGGSFDAFHYSSTSGVGVNLLNWGINRPFIFFENSISYRRNFSIFGALQADSPAGNPAVAAPGAGIGSSFFTMRWSPLQLLQFDFNHTYFRNIPTFDPTLVGTGLLDKYLFQGFSGGAHVDVVKQIAIYTELGRSSRTGDSSNALNQMYGITFGRVPWLQLRADAHYSRFNSSFGSGTYRVVTLSRNINESLRLEILAGDQAFVSALAGNQSARFVTATMENNLGSSLFTQAGFTVYRGEQQNYNQWMLLLGYRFDSKWKRK